MFADGGNRESVHALGLISGGLDSTLAAALLLKQGIQVTGLNFYTGFCTLEHRRRMKNADKEKLENPALKTEKKVMFPVELIDISKDYLELVTHPRYGYGKNANPCIDCRIMMLRRAKELMAEFAADFIFTGEVLGQRPMTQMQRTLDLIEKRADLKGYLLRPLSAKLLPPTIPEERGWLDREQLKDFRGRTRKPQIELAKQFGIEDYPQPAGGCCFLTDPGYSRKFFDLLDHRDERTVSIEDFELLKVGRHLRVKEDLKLVVGRNEAENAYLKRFRKNHISLEALDYVGPLTLIEGEDSPENRYLGAAVTARYSDAPQDKIVKVKIVNRKCEDIIEIEPVSKEDTDGWLIR